MYNEILYKGGQQNYSELPRYIIEKCYVIKDIKFMENWQQGNSYQIY